MARGHSSLRPATAAAGLFFVLFQLSPPLYAAQDDPPHAEQERPEAQQEAPEPEFVARDVEPKLENRREIQQLLVRLYPSALREDGVGGSALLWVFVDEKGVPAKSQVMKSSGYPAMDEAAAQVVSKMEFTPAQHDERPIGVWVQQVVTFRVN